MQWTSPYDLKNTQASSNDYYRTIADFTTWTIDTIFPNYFQEVTDYMQWLEKEKWEPLRSFNEYALEYLMLGILEQSYQKYAEKLKPLNAFYLKAVVFFRRKSDRLKPFFSHLKAQGSQKLMQQTYANVSSKSNGLKKHWQKLLVWLAASGEYSEEVIRLIPWIKYFKHCNNIHLSFSYHQLIQTVQQFESQAAKQLHSYLPSVTAFNQAHCSEQREDLIFIVRKPIIYYLNMMGAELLSRIFEKDFKKTEEKFIFLPGCMSSNGPAHYAQGSSYEKLTKCKKCLKTCAVYQIEEIAQKYGAQVRIVYHESALSKLKRTPSEKSAGVIGVACILNLISGGFKAKRLGYIPMCVILDYCGCQTHWHPVGISTELNKKQLIKWLT